MRKPLNVHIPNPCHMKWKDMDKIQGSSNRHCRECSVDLVDFTKMADDEIIAYLSEHESGKNCVRMYQGDALSDASKTQVTLLNWYKRIRSSRLNRHLKALTLVIFGAFLLTACGCEEEIPLDYYPMDIEQDSLILDEVDKDGGDLDK